VLHHYLLEKKKKKSKAPKLTCW